MECIVIEISNKKDITRAIQKLKNIDIKTNILFGHIGKEEFRYKNKQEVIHVLENYNVPWYKISVEFFCCENDYINCFEDIGYSYCDHLYLIMFGVPLFIFFILYETCHFILKETRHFYNKFFH